MTDALQSFPLVVLVFLAVHIPVKLDVSANVDIVWVNQAILENLDFELYWKLLKVFKLGSLDNEITVRSV